MLQPGLPTHPRPVLVIGCTTLHIIHYYEHVIRLFELFGVL